MGLCGQRAETSLVWHSKMYGKLPFRYETGLPMCLKETYLMADALTRILKDYSKAQCVKLYFSDDKREAALILDTCIKNGYHFFL